MAGYFFAGAAGVFFGLFFGAFLGSFFGFLVFDIFISFLVKNRDVPRHISL
jgi:hypothetical protein